MDTVKVILQIVMGVATLVALYATYMVNFGGTGELGTVEASLTLLTLGFVSYFFLVVMKK